MLYVGVILNINSFVQYTIEKDKIGAEGAEEIGKALLKNRALTILNIGSNNIGNEGAKAIGDALLKNKTLTTLNLGNNLADFSQHSKFINNTMIRL